MSSACATAPGWRPLVTGGARDVVLGALRDLVAGLSRPDRIEPRADLAGGDPGLALLFGALAAGPAPAPIDCDARALARAYLDRAIEEIARRRMPPALYSGWLGTAWVAQHLADDLFRPGGDPCGALVPILAGQVERGADGAHHDLTTGLAGAAVFALERGDRPSLAILERITRALGRSAIATAAGLTWRTAPRDLAPHARARYPHGCFNVGVAHGVPGVCAVLAQAEAAGVPGAGSLRRGATAWLLAQAQPEEVGSALPSYFAPGEPPRCSRLAWCYGDAGAAAALATAARAAGDDDLLAGALAIGRRAAAREPTRCGVADAGLCHGSAGLALLFQRLHAASGDACFARAARDWLADTLARLATGGAPREPGLLDGRAGVALCLLAALSPREPTWDAILLLSPAGAPRAGARTGAAAAQPSPSPDVPA